MMFSLKVEVELLISVTSLRELYDYLICVFRTRTTYAFLYLYVSYYLCNDQTS